MESENIVSISFENEAEDVVVFNEYFNKHSPVVKKSILKQKLGFGVFRFMLVRFSITIVEHSGDLLLLLSRCCAAL